MRRLPSAIRTRTNEGRTRTWLVVALLLATAVVASATSADASNVGSTSRVVDPAPVPSLDPPATADLWRRLVATRARRVRTTAACRPLRAVFYTPTDWLRVATTLAANASPCADYYVSIPPLTADPTQPRPDAASRIRALGSNFHAMAEVRYAPWSRWVTSTGSSWYTAGVTARQRMAAAGYDVSAGDTWAMNESSTAVRRGTGAARANLRDFLRGLYEGDGKRPTRGTVYVIGVGQQSSDLSLYQTNLQNWFTDSAFWSDMSTYVSDWSQEVFGDFRNYAVPAVPIATRRDYLNDYLQHAIVLSGAGPSTIETARTFLGTAFSPLANAAWEWGSGYGWTMVPEAQMAGYVSAQVYALRYFSATSGQSQDHWGFAWSPRNTTGMDAESFAAQTGQILGRLAAAVHDSDQTGGSGDPGSAACGPGGQNVWCADDLEGAHLTEAWKSFRSWTQSVLQFGTPAQTLRAGSPSAPMSLGLVTSTGRSATTPAALAVTLGSSSPKGTFSTNPSGPWSQTLPLTIAAGTGTSGAFYYQDTFAGSHQLTATAAGTTTGTQTVTIVPGSVVSLALKPGTATVRARASAQLAAVGRDTFGNVGPVSAVWSLTPSALGTLAPRQGSTAVFTAGRTVGSVAIAASVARETGSLSATATVNVVAGRLEVSSIRYVRQSATVFATLTTVDATGKAVSHASVSVLVRRDGRRYLTAYATTGPSGHAVYRIPARRAGCFTMTVRAVSAEGFVWDGRTPRNVFCRPRSG